MRRLRLRPTSLGLLCALLAGLAGWSAHPPVSLGYTSLLVVPLLLAGIVAVTPPDAGRSLLPVAAVGYVTGLVTFGPMLPWLIHPAGYLAWIALCLFISLWYTLAAILLAPWVRSGWIVAVAPVVWTGVEAWRNRVPLGGFGWGSFADAQVETLLLPLARIVGGNGLTFAVALIGVLLFYSVRRGLSSAAGVATLRASGPALIGAGAILVAALTAGLTAPDYDTETIDVLAVQGNDTEEPLYTTSRERHIAIATNMLAQTQRSVDEQGLPDLTVWPESAIDRDPWGSGAYLLPYLEEAIRVTQGNLLAGAILDGPDPATTFRNTVLHVDGEGTVTDRYTKRRYVPFGEYVPWPWLREFIPALAQVPRDGVRENGPHAVTTAYTDVAVLICFETLFSDVTRENVRSGNVGLIVAATNDASFGRTAEPAQHLNQSRLRAMETGRYVIHAALSGSSAIVDDRGNVLTQTGLFEVDSLRADVPILTAHTPFVRMGDILGTLSRWATVVLLLLTAGELVARRRTGARP